MASRPRPIHFPRALRSTPDEAEPSFSYEQESFLGGKEDLVEDEFHRRLAGSRRETSGAGGPGSSGNSFWRTSTDSSATSQSPSFSSVTFKGKTDNVKDRKGSSLLAAAIESGDSFSNGNDRDHVSSFRCGECCDIFRPFSSVWSFLFAKPFDTCFCECSGTILEETLVCH